MVVVWNEKIVGNSKGCGIIGDDNFFNLIICCVFVEFGILFCFVGIGGWVDKKYCWCCVIIKLVLEILGVGIGIIGSFRWGVGLIGFIWVLEGLENLFL